MKSNTANTSNAVVIPLIEVCNDQRDARLPLRRLRSLWTIAAQSLAHEQKLPRRILMQLVSEEIITQLHARHLNDPTSADVITFPYGEIFICPAVAQRQAPQWQRTILEEVLLYGIHGLLHVAGWSDKTPAQARAMSQKQEELFHQVLRKAV